MAEASPPSLEPEPFPSLLGGGLGRQMTPPVVLEISCHIYFFSFLRQDFNPPGRFNYSLPGLLRSPEAGRDVGRWRHKGLNVHRRFSWRNPGIPA